MSNSFSPHGLQHARLSYPSLSPRVCSNSCPLSGWCYLTISSSAAPFSSCPQSFPVSGSFPVRWLYPSGGQSVGASASASVLPMNTQDWFPLLLFWVSLSQLFTPLFHPQLKRLFSCSSFSAILVVSSVCLRLLVFLLTILIPAYWT